MSLLLCCTLTACSKEEGLAPSGTKSTPVITLLTAINGLGDRGYNDLIIQGVFRAQQGERFRLQTFSPESVEEAEQMLKYWFEKYKQSSDPQLLLIASDDYDSLATAYLSQFPDDERSRVLLFERSSPLPPAYTFHLPLYGAAYEAGVLAGVLSRERDEGNRDAWVVLANPHSPALQNACRGFSKGYANYCDGNIDTPILSHTHSGFYAIDEAYKLAGLVEQNVAFVYPLIGGSIWGFIYRSVEDEAFMADSYLMAGMDVDMSSYSPSVVFSTAKHIDRVVEQYINEWLQGKEWTRHANFNLASGFVENVGINPFIFFLSENLTEQQIHEEALQQEHEYEATQPY